MILRVLLFLFASTSLQAQTYEEFASYTNTYIYSNLYHAVNERIYSTMIGAIDDGTGTNRIEEVYAIDPIPPLYQVAFDPSGSYFETYPDDKITNIYLQFENVYPNTPGSNYFWAMPQHAEYPLTNEILFGPAIDYDRYMWAKASSNVATRVDLGLAIHKKTAELIALEHFAFTNILDTINTATERYNTTNAYEWNAGKFIFQYNWADVGNCTDPNFEPDWRNTPPPDFNFVFEAFGTEEFPECATLRIVADTNTQEWIVRGANYHTNYPVYTVTNYITNSVGSIATNIWIETLEQPQDEVLFGWQAEQYKAFTVTNSLTHITNNDLVVHMTNYAYPAAQYYQNGTNAINLPGLIPFAFLKFSEVDYVSITTTVSINGTNELKTTENKKIKLDIQQQTDINNIPDPEAYVIEALSENIAEYPVEDNANLIIHYINTSTNRIKDHYSTDDLPEFELVEKNAARAPLEADSGFVIATNKPTYWTTNYFVRVGDLPESTDFDEPFGNGYNYTINISTNNTGIFDCTLDSCFYAMTQTTYSVSTNLNEPFPVFPINETWVFLLATKPLHIKPDDQTSNLHIDHEWLYKRWNQLKLMRVSYPLVYSNTTNIMNQGVAYSAVQSNYFQSQFGPGGNVIDTVTTNYLNVDFDGKIFVKHITDINEFEIEASSPDADPFVSYSRSYSTINGQLNLDKSTNISGVLKSLKYQRYNVNRYSNEAEPYYDDCNWECYEFTVERTGRKVYGVQINCTGDLQPFGLDFEVNEDGELYSEAVHQKEELSGLFYWQVDKIEIPDAIIIDDRGVAPGGTLICADGKEYMFTNYYYGSSRYRINTSVQHYFTPLWDWTFEWPAEP